jgi:hypothetical protein
MTKLYSEAEKTEISTRMAENIVAIVRAKGRFMEHDLRAAGFSEHEITRFLPLAHGLAAIEFNRADPPIH